MLIHACYRLCPNFIGVFLSQLILVQVVNRKSQGYGLPADIWSLGCTVLEMLTGRVPYSNLEWVRANVVMSFTLYGLYSSDDDNVLEDASLLTFVSDSLFLCLNRCRHYLRLERESPLRFPILFQKMHKISSIGAYKLIQTNAPLLLCS